MSGITFHVLLAGVVGTVVGLILQSIGRAAFSRFKGDDTKELSAVVGFRVSAIFGIAVGLIFASTAAHLMEAKKDVLEEARLMATLYVLAADSPTLASSGAVRDDPVRFRTFPFPVDGPRGCVIQAPKRSLQPCDTP